MYCHYFELVLYLAIVHMHQAKGTDYLSRVAWLAGIPLDKFMLDNTEAVKDLDAALAGVNLLLCGPAPGAGGSEGPWGGGGCQCRECQCQCQCRALFAQHTETDCCPLSAMR
jgi:hypothetical protein